MAKQSKNTFAEMSQTLKSLGFVPAKRGHSIVFTYPNGGPVILLPAYKSGEAVKPIHRMMVHKQLMDAGLTKSGIVPVIGDAKVAQHRKAATRPKVAKKVKAAVKPSSASAKRGHKLEA